MTSGAPSSLWQHLANASIHGEAFRHEATKQLGCQWNPVPLVQGQVWELWAAQTDQHRALIHAIAGSWMGRDHRRGAPYTWIPSHLADAEGRISLRSFLVALRKAVEHSQATYPNHDWPLYYESVKGGVQAASKVRVDELQEDYPWVEQVMAPLKGLVVPCEFAEIVRRWEEADILQSFNHQASTQRLPPEHLSKGAEGLRVDLEQLAIFLRLRDGRVNIPDVFRVGYGIGRRGGGVRPLRQAGSA